MLWFNCCSRKHGHSPGQIYGHQAVRNWTLLTTELGEWYRNVCTRHPPARDTSDFNQHLIDKQSSDRCRRLVENTDTCIWKGNRLSKKRHYASCVQGYRSLSC